MRTHQLIDERSLLLAQAIVDKIDNDPTHSGLEIARSCCQTWGEKRDEPAIHEWALLLNQPWHDIRKALLDRSENGTRLRQSSPFCGILSPRERWKIFKNFSTTL
jgi:hypothetical protein